jgi:ABC-type uncharacterized transport system substrate-binding protein
MPHADCHRRTLTATLVAAAVLALAGCASAPPPATDEPLQTPVAAVPEPAQPPPPPAASKLPKPQPAAPRRDVTIVFDAHVASAATVAAAVADALPPKDYRVATADSESLRAPAPRSEPAVVIAVGLAAIAAAREKLPGRPIVFCQVFAYEDVLKDGGAIWGVHALPPPELQFRTWQTIDPTLRTIAVILGAEHGDLAAEAAKAAASVNAEMRFETSHSDRETLYLFKRMATQVDGLWLLPDNRVLSPTVLRELMSYATAHGVGVLALNDSLLRLGALATATSVTTDIADTVREVAERVVAGKTRDLPPMTALHAAELHVNPTVAAALGLPRVSEAHWVVRDHD